jgi:hypothetical protein
MKYIYFDESGDLGFDFTKHKTSDYFLATFLMSENKRAISSVVKKIFLSMPKNARMQTDGTLHAFREKPRVISSMLSKLAEKDVKIAVLVVDKHKMIIGPEKTHDMYAGFVSTLVNRLFADGEMSAFDEIMLVASKRETSRRLNNKFMASVTAETKSATFKVAIIRPYEDKCLQAADFVSYAFWRKYEKGDTVYTDILADKIVAEYEYRESCEGAP